MEEERIKCPICGKEAIIYVHGVEAHCSHLWGSLSRFPELALKVRKIRRKAIEKEIRGEIESVLEKYLRGVEK